MKVIGFNWSVIMAGYKKILSLVLLSFVSMNAVAMSVRAIRAVSAVSALASAGFLEKEECDKSERDYYSFRIMKHEPVSPCQQKHLTATLNSYGVYPKNLHFIEREVGGGTLAWAIEREPKDNALAWAYDCVNGHNLVAVPPNFCTRRQDSDKVALLHEAGHILDKHSEKSRKLNIVLGIGDIYASANVLLASVASLTWYMKGFKKQTLLDFKTCIINQVRFVKHALKHSVVTLAMVSLMGFISERALGRYEENYADDFARKHCIWANDQEALRSDMNYRSGDPSSEKYWYYSRFKSEYCTEVKEWALPKGIKDKLLEDRNWAQFANKYPNLWRYAIQPAVDPHDIPSEMCKKHAEAIKQADELHELVGKVHGIGMMKVSEK